MDKYSEELNSFIEKLKESNKAIVVEGEKDKKALEQLGIKKIITLNKGPLFKIAENISKEHKDVIILTDLDKKGKQLYGRLNSSLQRLGLRVDNSFRNFLLKKTKLSQIEGINTYLNKRV
ncbi:MAG: toprim domain-containing protein [Nanoarchaeota archaeon]|nr:toprim domain-containing protein [Nanoarchaeota archaeon]MBU4284111.1 toprim domain-containing protein [Nanoarchaeota archaeon]